MPISESERSQDVFRRRGAENTEAGFESKEDKESQELKKAAAHERAETISREIKNTKKQMQNIIVHMQQVIKAVQAIRAQLQLVQNTDDIPSVRRDEKSVEQLRIKLKDLTHELGDLRSALITEEYNRLKQEQPLVGEAVLADQSQNNVNKILSDLGVE